MQTGHTVILKSRRSIKELYESLWRGLKKVYIGEGLYINIDYIKINYPDVELPVNIGGESYSVHGNYGREDADRPEINFQYNFDIEYTDEDSNEFLSGMFYKILLDNEDAPICD